METSQLVIGIVLSLIGLLFFFKNKNIGKGACKIYRKFYTEKNLIIMFRIVGIFLFIMGLFLVFVD